MNFICIAKSSEKQQVHVCSLRQKVVFVLKSMQVQVAMQNKHVQVSARCSKVSDLSAKVSSETVSKEGS